MTAACYRGLKYDTLTQRQDKYEKTERVLTYRGITYTKK